ncbi:MAG: GldG family protein [Oscillospiraceae bacterium]|nr:GldG family protein [Oscillospiraceae bacterium]
MADLEKHQETEPETPETSKETNQKPKKEKKKLSVAARKKLKYGGIATAITCVVVAVVILVNVLVNVLVEKYPLKLDLTEDAKFEISEESISYLKTLNQDVNFTVLMAEKNFQTSGESLKMVSEILERYTQYTDKIHLRYVDPSTNPDVVNQYQANYSASLTEGDIVISNAADESKLRVVKIGNLFDYDQQKYAQYYYANQGSLEDCITGFSGEQNLTSALMNITDADPITIGVISTANGQAVYNAQFSGNALNALASTLYKNGYNIEDVDLYTTEFDTETYDMLLLPAPVIDLTANGIDKLSAFLYNDGKYDKDLIYIASFTQSDTPNLNEFLETWGIQVTNSLALESDATAAQQVALSISMGAVSVPVATIAEDTYSAGLPNTSLPIAAPLCRAINLLWESKTSGITSALLKTSDSVYLSEMGKNTEEADKTPAGAQIIAAVSSRKNIEDNVTHDSNIMVLGSAMLCDSSLMQDASYNNAQYLMTVINNMAGKGDSLVIASKNLTNETITITTAEMRGIHIVIFVIPSAVIAIGIMVFLRRRNK